MLGKEAIARFLEQKGIRYIFHLPGIHTLPVNQVLGQSNIGVLIGRHESNVGFMADGYSRATGLAGTVLVTPGPGLANMVSSCLEAYGDDVPLVIVHIDVNRKDVGKGVLHGVHHPESMFTHISKETLFVSEGKSLVTQLERAYTIALTERQGPVIISIPYNLLERDVPVLWEEMGRAETQFDPGPLEQALIGKTRPVIIGGRALMDSEIRVLLDEICREWGVPFLTTTSGKGVLREDSDCTFGNITTKGVARDILRGADVVIALGTRLREVDARRRGVKIERLVHIDVDDRWLGRNYKTELQLSTDMWKAVAALRALMKGRKSSWDMGALKRTRDREQSELQKSSPGFQIVTLLRQAIPEPTVTVWDLNLISYWAEYYFPVFEQRSFLSARGSSSIFYAFPASLGAKLGRPDRPCLSVVGDGSFAAVAGELSTVKKYGIPVVILVYNNSSFGILEDYMKKRYSLEGTMKLSNPDFLALAHAFDVKAKRADNFDELRTIFLNDIQWDEPYLVEFRYPIFPPPWQ